MKKRKLNKKRIVIASALLVLILLIIIVGIIRIRYVSGNSKYLEINLNGKKEVKVEYGEKYKDEGAYAFYKKKDISKDIKVTNNINYDKTGTYKYTYSIKYKKKTKKTERIVKVVDTKKPEIILNGDSEIVLTIGDTYKEELAKANDNYDGDLTSDIVITGNVDTGKVGEYVVVYTVSDSNGNKTSVERKVKVIEKKNNSNEGIIGKTSKGYKIEKKDGITYINGILIANKSYSLPRNYNPGDLLDTFKNNFNRMKEAAVQDGVYLIIGSGFRSYGTQEAIYNNYVNRDGREAADTYSARAGHSEHQTGLAADIYGEASKDKYLYQSWGETNDGKWLNNNCYKYGFILRYPKGKESQTGYMYESWHIRYVGEDIAKELYNNGNWITLEEYLGITSKY